MIDLASGTNGFQAPCSSCLEIDKIREVMDREHVLYNKSVLTSIVLLVAEVKMWRAKEEYDKRLKASYALGMVADALSPNGQQVDK